MFQRDTGRGDGRGAVAAGGQVAAAGVVAVQPPTLPTRSVARTRKVMLEPRVTVTVADVAVGEASATPVQLPAPTRRWSS